MRSGRRLWIVKYGPVVGLTVLFLAAVAFSASEFVTQRHVAIIAAVAGGTVSVGGFSILRDPRDAARYDTALTSVKRDTVPGQFAVTLMTAGGMALSLGGLALVAAALRHL